MKKIAIVGMGVSGLAVLLAYAKQLQNISQEYQFDCYDQKDSYGRGFPFRVDADSALLNSPSDAISFDPENMGDFKEWLEEEGRPIKTFYSRTVYGDYEEDRLKRLSLKIHPQFNQVERIEKHNNGWKVYTQKETKFYDQVHLCCGELPLADYFDLSNTPQYIHQPYPMIEQIKFNESVQTVGVIGMGLSSVDAIKFVSEKYPQAKILTFSPSNFFPASRAHTEKVTFEFMTIEKINAKAKENQGRLSLQAFEYLWDSECDRLGIDWDKQSDPSYWEGIDGLAKTFRHPDAYRHLQGLAMQVTVVLTDFWPKMTVEDQKGLKKKYGKVIKNLRNPMPPQSAEELIHLARDGRLVVIPQPEKIEWKGTYYQVDAHQVDILINATGQTLNERTLPMAQPLLQQMISDNYAKLYPLGGLTIDYASGQAMNEDNIIQENLFLHGQLINGFIYQNNSSIKIQEMAEKIVRVNG